jgi:hypothetical protein
VNQVYQQIQETEDDVEAAEDMKGASQWTEAHLLKPYVFREARASLLQHHFDFLMI